VSEEPYFLLAQELPQLLLGLLGALPFQPPGAYAACQAHELSVLHHQAGQGGL